MNISMTEALTALVSKYLGCVIAAEQSEVEEFFSNFIARSRVREAINALIAARELSFVHIGGRAMLECTPPRAPAAGPCSQATAVPASPCLHC